MVNKKNKKNIRTLIHDIYTLIDAGKKKPDKANVEDFLNVLKEEVLRFLDPVDRDRRTLRLSAVGKQYRKLWFEVNDPKKEEIEPRLKLLFFYGHIIEALLLFLAQEAGHKVVDRQKEVKLEGVTGHIDAIIDGVLVDVKSASDYGFKKFNEGTLLNDDPFGYIGQMSAYMEALNLKEGAFFAFNKNNAKLTLLEIDELRTINASERIQHLKKIIKSKKMPERCYSSLPFGKKGNRILDKNCVFCDYKQECWKGANDGEGLRAFKYAQYLRFFTKVVVKPDVEEVFLDEKKDTRKSTCNKS